MIDKIQHLYVKPVNFEEVPYESSGDLISRSVRQEDGSAVTLLDPPIVDFTVTLGPSDTTVYKAAQSAVAAYTRAGLPGVYEVIQTGDQVSVVPRQVRVSNGGMRELTPAMDASVEFPLATRSAVDTFELIAESISSHSGRKVVLGQIPFFLTDTVTMGASGEPARDVIARLGGIFRRVFSSGCLYEASFSTYWLNVQSIFAPPPPGVPASEMPPFILPGRRPAPNASGNTPLYTHQ